MGDKLKIFKNGGLLSEVPLGSDLLTIGRHRDANLQLEDTQLSRFHAQVTKSGDEYFLTDRKSLNGTVLNGAKLEANEPVRLADGAVVSISPFELHFKIADISGDLSEETHSTPDQATDGLAAAAQEIETSDKTALPIPDLSVLLERPPEAGLLLTHLVEQREQIPIWTKGKTVFQVADIIEETHDVKTFRLVGEEPILFSYLPGQFLTLKLDIDGKPVKRSYTISSSPSRPHTLELTVKRVRGGLVSNWLCDNLKLGDRLEGFGPSGKFSCFHYPSQKILCIGGGSGITPVMSMCRWIVDTAADVDVNLLASFHSPSDVIYRRELDVIASRHSGVRVTVNVSTRKGSEPWTGLTGRLTSDHLSLVCPDLLDRHIFMCGPEGFMDSVKDCLRELDYPLANLHSESFGSGRMAKNMKVEACDVPKHKPASLSALGDGLATAAPAPVQGAVAGQGSEAPDVAAQSKKMFKVQFANSGKEALTDGSSDLLELAEVNGIEIDYSCRSGSCGTCRVKCRSGSVEMEADGLEAGEKADGWILSCVAFPGSDLVVEA